MPKNETPNNHDFDPADHEPIGDSIGAADSSMPEHIQGYLPKGQDAVLEEERLIASDFARDRLLQQAAEQELFELEYGRHAEPVYHLEHKIGRFMRVRQILGQRFVGGLEYHQPEHDDRDKARHDKRELEAYNYERSKVLRGVREEIATFEEQNRDQVIDGEDVPNRARRKLNDYLEQQLPASFQDDYSQFVSTLEKNKIERLGDRVEWLSKASDSMLLNFLQWHNHRIDALNANPDFQVEVIKMKEQVKARLKADVTSPDGTLPPETLLAFKRIDDVRVIAGDVFDTSMQGLHGYYEHDPHHVVVSEAFDMETFTHEIYHSGLGHFDNRMMDEATAEHLTLAALYGDYQTMNPEMRDDRGEYVRFRQANDRVLNSGIEPVAIESQIDAYIEGRADGPRNRKFRSELDAAYGGVDVMAFIDQRMAVGYLREKDRDPESTYQERLDRAAIEVSHSFVILGQHAKGVSFDRMRANAAKDKRRDNTAWISRIDQVEAFVQQSQAPRTHRTRQAPPRAH